MAAPPVNAGAVNVTVAWVLPAVAVPMTGAPGTTALTLNDLGVLGVRALDESDTVRFIPVTLLDGTPEGAWVSGLPDQVRVITVGQEFVVEGQKVEPVSDTEKTPKAGGGAS